MKNEKLENGGGRNRRNGYLGWRGGVSEGKVGEGEKGEDCEEQKRTSQREEPGLLLPRHNYYWIQPCCEVLLPLILIYECVSLKNGAVRFE